MITTSNLGEFSGKKITLIVTGSIAIYKSLDLIRNLKKMGACVLVIMTKKAAELISPLTFQALSGETVLIDQNFSQNFSNENESMPHTSIAKDVDLLIAAPATASFLGKVAHGICNDTASTVVMASTCPVIFAPAMNPSMWEKPSLQRNIQTIKQDGMYIISPEIGLTACGDHGNGRMASCESIITNIKPFLCKNSTLLTKANPRQIRARSFLSNKRVMVTTGSTIENIDPVRYMSNHSSGKQGIEIAKAFQSYGAQVLLIYGKINVDLNEIREYYKVNTAQELHDKVHSLLPVDIFVSVAAVSDWKAKSVSEEKISLGELEDTLQINMVKNPDILASVSGLDDKKRPRVTVGFALESSDLVNRASAKRKRKGCDVIIANEVSDDNYPFGNDGNIVTWIDDTIVENWPLLSKSDIADRLVLKVTERFY